MLDAVTVVTLGLADNAKVAAPEVAPPVKLLPALTAVIPFSKFFLPIDNMLLIAPLILKDPPF